MSVIEDARKPLQDFLVPEMRELSARVEALEARMDIRFDGLEKSVDARFDSAERMASKRHAQSMLAIGRLADVHELRERITRIEAKERAS